MEVAKELAWLEARKAGCSVPQGYMERFTAFLGEIKAMGGPTWAARTCDKSVVLDSCRKFLYDRGDLKDETKHRFAVLGGPLRVRQIYYLEEQKEHLQKSDWIHPYFNESLDITLEHRVIRELIENEDHRVDGASYWGVFPHDYHKEAAKSSYRIERTILAHARNGVGVLSMYGPKGDGNDFFKKMESIYHTPKDSTRMALFQAICEAGGHKVPTLDSKVNFVSYRSTWLMSSNLVEYYVRDWLAPALDLIANDSEVRKLALGPTNYKSLGERLEKAWGRTGDDWPAAPFVLERLVSWFVTTERIKYGQL